MLAYTTMREQAVTFRLAEILEERNIKQVEFAQMMGTHRQTVNRLVGGVRQIDLVTLQKVCDALGVQPGELFEYTPSIKSGSH